MWETVIVSEKKTEKQSVRTDRKIIWNIEAQMSSLKAFIVVRRLLSEDVMITFVSEKIRKKMKKKKKIIWVFKKNVIIKKKHLTLLIKNVHINSINTINQTAAIKTIINQNSQLRNRISII